MKAKKSNHPDPILIEFNPSTGHCISLRDEIDFISYSPNEYFYIRRPPGEWINIEPLSDNEIKMFEARLQEFKIRYSTVLDIWGFFAVPFIGRTGEFLESFYMEMVRQGQISDPSIIIDETGNIQYHITRSLGNDQEILLRGEAFAYFMKFLPSGKKLESFLSENYMIKKQALAYRDKNGNLFIPNSKRRKVRMAPIPKPKNDTQSALENDQIMKFELRTNSQLKKQKASNEMHWMINLFDDDADNQ